jgi:antitoxin VapB
MSKSINIKNAEAAALIAELMAATGKGATELILELLRREADHRRKLAQRAKKHKRIDAIVKRARARIPKRAPPTDDLIEYDENGLPV